MNPETWKLTTDDSSTIVRLAKLNLIVGKIRLRFSFKAWRLMYVADIKHLNMHITK